MELSDRLWRFRRTVHARYPPLGQMVGGVHALTAGPETDLPIVLIHGASGNVRDWSLSVMPHLAERHRVIALDRPGFGYSTLLPDHGWRLSDQVAALRGALHALGHQRYILAGHSYGGTLVLRWVLEHPDDVAGLLALSAPALDWGGGGLGMHYEIGGRPAIGPALSHIAKVLAGPDWVRSSVEDVFAPDTVPASYLPEGGVELALRPHTFRANSKMMLRIYAEIMDQHERYDEIACPVEIVHGDADVIVPSTIHAERLTHLIPNNRLTLLPGIGHMPHHAAPDEVVAAVERLAAPAIA